MQSRLFAAISDGASAASGLSAMSPKLLFPVFTQGLLPTPD